MSEAPKSIWQGSFMLGNLEMRCHVLDDGTRIIEAECLEAFFENPLVASQEQVTEFARWFRTAKPTGATP